MTRILAVALLLGSFFLTDVSLGDETPYERLLLPIYLPIDRQGALGSAWRTEFVLRNEGSEPIDVFQSHCVHLCTCEVRLPTCFPGEPLLPNSKFQELVPPNSDDSALFLFVERAKVDDLAMNLRLTEQSRQHLGFGVETPIVRERDLRQGMTWLPNVPVSPLSRTHLRVYGVSSPSGEAVVRIRLLPGDDTIATYDVVHSIPPPALERRIPAPSDLDTAVPGYLELLIPQAAAAGESRIRVVVEPITVGLRFWAVASVTNNETQHVTLVTPQ